MFFWNSLAFSMIQQMLAFWSLVPLPLFFFLFFKILFYFLTLQYCIGFAIYRNESAIGVHVFPILNPPPSSSAFSKSSLNIWKFTVHILLKLGLENLEHFFITA